MFVQSSRESFSQLFSCDRKGDGVVHPETDSLLRTKTESNVCESFSSSSFYIFLVWRVVEFSAARGFASRRFDECPKTERLADFLRIFSVGCKKISDRSMIQRACSRSVLSPTCSVSLCSVLRRKGACSLTRSLRSPAHDMCRDVVIVNGSRRADEARQGGKPYVRE